MFTSDNIMTFASLVAIAVALGGIIWFFAGLDGRVRRLEEQVHTLTVAPTIADSQPTTAGVPNSPVQDPIADTSAKLALQATEAIRKGSPMTEGQPIQELMQKLGCISK
jgi:hypothetical protein